jgi:hypothetical protein
LAAELEIGSYIVVNRSVSTGLGGLATGAGRNLRPDILVMRRVSQGGQVRWRCSMYEVRSGSQTPQYLQDQLDIMRTALPPNVIPGSFQVLEI